MGVLDNPIRGNFAPRDFIQVPKFEYNWRLLCAERARGQQGRLVRTLLSLSIQIFGEETYSRAATPCMCARHLCMHMRVLRTQEQLASATRSSCRNVMFAIVEYAWCTQHHGYISLPGIYMTACTSPFVALTISLIVYATENASAPLAQCWFRYTTCLPREESNVTNVASHIFIVNNCFRNFIKRTRIIIINASR